MGRRGGRNRKSDELIVAPPEAPTGGALRPLPDALRDRIIDAAFEILSKTGMGDCPPDVARQAIEQGAALDSAGRLCFPRRMVERAIARASKTVRLPGYVEDRGIDVGGGRVHIGTGGAAVEVLKRDLSGFAPATLADLWCLMQIVNKSPNVSYGVRPVVARDMDTPELMDINTAYACLAACSKPIGVSFDNARHVAPITKPFDMALGEIGGFARHPFCFAVVVHAVSPLRFAPDGVDIMIRAMTACMPLQICTAAQAGATSPVTLAGALAQGLAEALAGLMVVDALRPGFPCIFAFMPFISDLRTGSMTGGGGEGAIANAAAAQLLLHLGLPSTVSAGMTDAKLADVQAGYEKGYTVALAAHAGADMINLGVGMLGSIMAASPEALVIDDDMCGAILRSVRGIGAGEDEIDLALIDQVAKGPGHYLGEAQTRARMKTDYVYPMLGNRQSIADWRDAGAPEIWDAARARVDALLAEPPDHLPPERKAVIRDAFDIRLIEELGS